MLYLIKYFSIFVLFSITIVGLTSTNGLDEEDKSLEENRYFAKIWNIVLKIAVVAMAISMIAIRLVKTTYYKETELVSKNEIVSIEKNNTRVICEYKDENGDTIIKSIKLKHVDLTEYKSKETDWKITEYVVYTKTDMNPILFKILTFDNLPEEETCYKIEK